MVDISSGRCFDLAARTGIHTQVSKHDFGDGPALMPPRDVKPHNLLIFPGALLKLSDFGSAAPLVHLDGSSTPLVDPTFATVAVGTPDYIAPEILLHAEKLACLLDAGEAPSLYGTSVDWWSLGCTAFEMGTGLPPFWAPSIRETYGQIVSTGPSHTLSKCSHMSPQWQETLDWYVDSTVESSLHFSLLNKSPQRRPCLPSQLKSLPAFGQTPWASVKNGKLQHPSTKPLTDRRLKTNTLGLLGPPHHRAASVESSLRLFLPGVRSRLPFRTFQHRRQYIFQPPLQRRISSTAPMDGPYLGVRQPCGRRQPTG